MKSHTARLTLLILFVVTLGVTAFLFWNGESLVSTATVSLRSFATKSESLSRVLLDVRMAQRAYVATGQGGEFWATKVSTGAASVLSGLEEVKRAAVSPQAVTELEAAEKVFGQFAQLDRRAREYARTGQNLLASDLIFSDGAELTESTSARIASALAAETSAREGEIQTFRRRQLFALAAAAAAALLVVLLLYPVDQGLPAAASDRLDASGGPNRVEQGVLRLDDGWDPPRPARDGVSDTQPLLRGAASAPGGPAAEIGADAAGPPMRERAFERPPVDDFSGLASLCTDLARVVDTEQLPGLLERASALLDASGIILWIADPDARELNPILAQGYPPQLLDRLGALPRDAENATAAAFRTSLLQTVKSNGNSQGAIAAPLVTGSGCVGVMAAEVRNEAEQQDGKLAAAAIMAAQLAALVGPPASRQGKMEAAGA